MRSNPCILHVDLDGFFASVEQRDKPSLRGRPVVVGGLGPRGVVATASYEARVFGVGSAMPMAEARRRCPRAAFLAGRFPAYRQASDGVMGVLRALSPLVEPISLDEAFVDLAAGDHPDLGAAAVRSVAERLKADIADLTALTASVGAASSRLLAKIASDLDKPDGLLVVPPGDEIAVLHPLPVSRLWGVGPATEQRLHRLGVRTIGELARVPEPELVALLGQAQGHGLHRLAWAGDDRAVVSEREAKSVGAEETFDVDLVDRGRLGTELDVLAARTAERLVRSGHSGRTVTVKVRLHDFRTLSRSATLAGPTDDIVAVRRLARALLGEVDVTGGVRLLGVAVSGLSDHVQDELPDLLGFATPTASPAWELPVPSDPPAEARAPASEEAAASVVRRFVAGQDVVHDEHGRGWVQGSGVGRVTVRLETSATAPGPVRTWRIDDPALHPAGPLPYEPGTSRGCGPSAAP